MSPDGWLIIGFVLLVVFPVLAPPVLIYAGVINRSRKPVLADIALFIGGLGLLIAAVIAYFWLRVAGW